MSGNDGEVAFQKVYGQKNQIAERLVRISNIFLVGSFYVKQGFFLRHSDRISNIYRLSKSDIPRDGAKLAVRLKADSSWDIYARQGFVLHELPDLRDAMVSPLKLPFSELNDSSVGL
jgi:hypothetical protein